MPILEFDGNKLVYESLITAEYLEEVYPTTCPLNSTDPYQRARDRIYVELFGKVISNYNYWHFHSGNRTTFIIHPFCYQVTRGMFKLYRANKDDETTWRIPIASIERGLSWFEEELGKRGSTFFGGKIYQWPSLVYFYGNSIFKLSNFFLSTGDKPGMLDYMIWPWFERMPMLPIVSQGVISVALNKFPKLVSYTFFYLIVIIF